MREALSWLVPLALGAVLLAACTFPQPTPTPKPTSSPTPTLDATPEVDTTYQRRTPFVPLDNPGLLSADRGTYLLNDDLVLGLEWGGEARAYPVRMLRFHHIVNDTVAGRPLLITY